VAYHRRTTTGIGYLEEPFGGAASVVRPARSVTPTAGGGLHHGVLTTWSGTLPNLRAPDPRERGEDRDAVPARWRADPPPADRAGPAGGRVPRVPSVWSRGSCGQRVRKAREPRLPVSPCYGVRAGPGRLDLQHSRGSPADRSTLCTPDATAPTWPTIRPSRCPSSTRWRPKGISVGRSCPFSWPPVSRGNDPPYVPRGSALPVVRKWYGGGTAVPYPVPARDPHERRRRMRDRESSEHRRTAGLQTSGRAPSWYGTERPTSNVSMFNSSFNGDRYRIRMPKDSSPDAPVVAACAFMNRYFCPVIRKRRRVRNASKPECGT